MIGMDITPEMLAVGSKKLLRMGLQDRIELRVGDAEHIDLPDNSVDGCCSAFMVRNLTDIEQGFPPDVTCRTSWAGEPCLKISHPPGKVFGALFYLYFYKLAPLFGTILGKAFEAYNYLPNSLTTFPKAPALRKLWKRQDGAMSTITISMVELLLFTSVQKTCNRILALMCWRLIAKKPSYSIGNDLQCISPLLQPNQSLPGIVRDNLYHQTIRV